MFLQQPSSRNGSRRRYLLVSIVLTAIALFVVTLVRDTEVSAKDSNNSDLFAELKIFTDVLAIVQRDYVKPVDNKKLVEGAIKGMLATLDPHSGYLDPDFYKDLQVQTKGEFGGLGIEITIKDGLLVVVSPMEGSPAEAAGIRAGDAIVKIDGKFTKDFSLVDAVKKMRGPKGSPIVLSIYRKGNSDLLDITVVRDNIQVKSVKSRYLGNGIGYVRVSQFMEKTEDDLKAALKGLVRKNDGNELSGLVLDLRNNPGGLLTQAVKVSDLFLSDGLIVYTDGRVESQKQKFYAHARGTEPNYPLAVIINGGSASASEIVAGALQDAARGIIVGTQSFGKGSVQTITPLENGGALTLTTALYYTKSGRSIQLTGVKPDVEVEAPVDTAAQQAAEKEEKKEPLQERIREGDLPGAIQNPNIKNGSDSTTDVIRQINQTPAVHPEVTAIDPEKEDIGSWMKRDPQFAKAVDLVKNFDVLKKPAAPTAQHSSAPAPEQHAL